MHSKANWVGECGRLKKCIFRVKLKHNDTLKLRGISRLYVKSVNINVKFIIRQAMSFISQIKANLG